MKLALINRERLQSLGAGLVDELDSMIARIRAGWNVEHTEGGAHGSVHATAVATGRIVFSDIIGMTIADATVNDFQPSGLSTAAIVRLNSTLSEATITGIAVPQDTDGRVLDGRVLVLENVSASGTVFRFPYADTRSIARNRLDVPRVGTVSTFTSTTLEIRLHPASTLVLVYNASKACWIAHSQSNESHIAYITTGSSQNDWTPVSAWRSIRILRLGTTAADLTISGLSVTGIPDTERRTIVNDGVWAFSLLHANTSSAVSNRIYCPGGIRYLLHPRESVELQRIDGGGWRVLEKAHQWIDVNHDAGNFTASAGTWTVESGDQLTFAYQIDGDKMTVDFHIATSSVSATPAALKITIPDGRTSSRKMHNTIQVSDNGTRGTGYAEVTAGGTTIDLYLTSGANWATAVNTTGVWGQIQFMLRDSGISEPHTDVAHGDTAHSDSAHSDVAHVDVAHGDSHQDASHDDVPHSDTAHVDGHNDTAHTDTAHTDTHQDTAHSDAGHSDTAHTDVPHDDVAHNDVTHQDHTDDVFPHEDTHDDHLDNEHQDTHGDHTDTFHEDVAHTDVAHTDTAHSDVAHADTPHNDVAHVDTHGDNAHGDVAHVDSHNDTAHADTAHTDGGHADAHSDTAPHADTAHVDVAHGDTTHADSVHGDVGYHTDTAHSDI